MAPAAHAQRASVLHTPLRGWRMGIVFLATAVIAVVALAFIFANPSAALKAEGGVWERLGVAFVGPTPTEEGAWRASLEATKPKGMTLTRFNSGEGLCKVASDPQDATDGDLATEAVLETGGY